MLPKIALSCRYLASRQNALLGAWHRYCSPHRVQSTFGLGGDSKDRITTNDTKGAPNPSEEDIFGVDYEDGEDRMGPISSYPPQFKRDATTGRFTGEVENQMTEEERKILTSDSSQQNSMVLTHIEEHWKKQGDNWGSELGRRVREAEMGLTVLGRSPKAQATKPILDDDLMKDAMPRSNPTGFSQRLTREEFESFREYMKNQHSQDINPDDFPVIEKERTPKSWSHKGDSKTSPDKPEVAMKWMTNYSRHQMDDLGDDPYADVMPADLNMYRLVSRKDAKPIPRSLMHHNNLALLKSFLTPTSQIKHRMHTRLGAKDQRKISKFIRRARQMGLLPHTGQCSIEQEGWIHAPDIHEKRDWEAELERRGLVVQEPEKKVVFKELEELLNKD